MHDGEDRAVVEYILAAWRALAPATRPPCLWLRLHAPLPPGHEPHRIATPLIAAWFADRRSLRPRSVWAYVRFHVVHIDQPWCGRVVRERDAVFGEPHRIGVAAFARRAGTGQYYVEVSWAVRHGEGQRIGLDARGEARVQERLWIA